jgi:hypothetical protein
MAAHRHYPDDNQGADSISHNIPELKAPIWDKQLHELGAQAKANRTHPRYDDTARALELISNRDYNQTAENSVSRGVKNPIGHSETWTFHPWDNRQDNQNDGIHQRKNPNNTRQRGSRPIDLHGKGYINQPTRTPPTTMIKNVLRKRLIRSFLSVRHRKAKNTEIRRACQMRRKK